MKMRAAVLEKGGQPLTIFDDVDIIEPRAGEVRVRIKYCGLCHSDFGFVSGKSPMARPTILGHEAAGIIESIGAGVRNLAIGDPVVLTPAPPCGQCYFCQRNEHSLCVNAMGILSNSFADGSTGLSRHNEILGRGCGMGALAEYVVIQATGAIKVDKDVPLDIACVIGCALQTGVGAVLNTANVEQGASVLVMGLGGVGMSTVQGARIAGATTIIAVDPVADRRQAALSFGASHVIDPESEDVAGLCSELTAGIGVDYAFESAGFSTLVEQCIAITRMGGTTVSVGSPALEENLTINNFVLFAATQKKLCGCLLGSCNSSYEIPRLLRLWQQGLLDMESMITSRRSLADVNSGFDDLKNKKGIRTVIEI